MLLVLGTRSRMSEAATLENTATPSHATPTLSGSSIVPLSPGRSHSASSARTEGDIFDNITAEVPSFVIPHEQNNELDNFPQSRHLCRFTDRKLDDAVLCQLWLLLLRIEYAMLAGIAIFHIALLVQDVILSLPTPVLATVFAVVDGLQLIMIAALVICIERNLPQDRATKRVPVGLFNITVVDQVRVQQADPRSISPPAYYSSGEHDIQLAIIVFLASVRLSLVDVTFCSASAEIISNYQPCQTYLLGAYPFPGLASCIIISGVYSYILSARDSTSLITVTTNYAAVLAVAVVMTYGTAKQPPKAADTVLICIMVVVAWATQVGMCIYKVASWRRDRKLFLVGKQFYTTSLQLAQARQAAVAQEAQAKWRTQLGKAREEGYRRAVAYSAHELRNPLHCILGLIEFDQAILHELVDAVELDTKPKARLVLADLEEMQARTSSMQRIINDVTAYSKFQSRTELGLSYSTCTISSIVDSALSSCKMFSQPTTKFIHPDTPQEITTDCSRLSQVLLDCTADAISHGAESLQILCLPLFNPLLNEALQVRLGGPASELTTDGPLQWVALCVAAVGIANVTWVDADYVQLSAAADATSGMGFAPTPTATPTHRRSSIAMSARSGSLSKTVALMLCRRLGGDLLVLAPRQSVVYYFCIVPTCRVFPATRRARDVDLLVSTQIFGDDGVLNASAQESLIDFMVASVTAVHEQVPLLAGRQPSASPQAEEAARRQRRNSVSLHILYAEDELSNRKVMARYLNLLGCSYVMVPDGIHVPSALITCGMLTPDERKAVNLPEAPALVKDVSNEGMEALPFDVLLLDVVMPHMDGAHLCRNLRNLGGRWSTIPILAITGNAYAEHWLQEGGFTAVISKPCNLKMLREALAAHCI